MKTLTYGTLPSKLEFSTAYALVRGHSIYVMKLNPSDASHLSRFPVDFTFEDHSRTATFTAAELYDLCKALADAGNRADLRQWANNFCSSILTTLGFEWV